MVVRRLEGRVFWIEFDRPDKLNSLDSKTLIEAREAVLEGCRSEASLVALTGRGRLFSSGMDLGEIASASSPGDVRGLFEKFVSLLEAIISCREEESGAGAWKPVVALLNGPAVAGGAELALAVDVAFAVKGSWLQWPELRWGLIPPMLAGFASATASSKLVYTGLGMIRIPAEEAAGLGLIAGVVEDLDEGVRVVEMLANNINEGGWKAVGSYLSGLRRVKQGWLERARDLVVLSEREDFIAKAREFLERKG